MDKGVMQRLMRASCGGLAMWRGWRGMIAKRVYVGECGVSHSGDWPWKRWIDTVKECLRKRGLDGRQTRRMDQDRSECIGHSPGDELLTLMGCHSYMKVLKSVCG